MQQYICHQRQSLWVPGVSEDQKVDQTRDEDVHGNSRFYFGVGEKTAPFLRRSPTERRENRRHENVGKDGEVIKKLHHSCNRRQLVFNCDRY